MPLCENCGKPIGEKGFCEYCKELKFKEEHEDFIRP